jgi:DNA-binding transcriptional ArsR family regulator
MATNQFDRFVQDEEERAQAARQLADIAGRFPELLRRAAQLCQNGEATTTTPPPAASRSAKQVPTSQLVLAYLCERGEASAHDVVRDLSAKVRTGSDKPSTVIYATLTGLRRAEKIEFRQLGGKRLYKLAGEQVVQSAEGKRTGHDRTRKTNLKRVIDALRGVTLTMEQLQERTGLTRQQVRSPMYAKGNKKLFKCVTDEHGDGHYSLVNDMTPDDFGGGKSP